MARLILIISFFIACLGVPMMARAAVECTDKPAGIINVVWKSDKIQYDFTKSQAQMDRMQIDTKNPYDRSITTHVGGLMQGGISVKSDVQISTLTYPVSNQVCQWLDTMNVYITIDPKIMVAKQHEQGTCRHKAILNHEMKHIFVDRDIVRQYVPKIKRALEDALRDVGVVGPNPEGHKDIYQKKIGDYMEQSLNEIIEQMYQARNKKQQSIDTITEYERVQNLCH